MKRIAYCIGLVVIIIIAGIYYSYSIAKTIAEKNVQNYHGAISPLKSQFVLFIDNELNPCWVFRSEYNDALTGATYDVYVTLFGSLKTHKAEGTIGGP